jgi:pimeloyl-ACP methyl ester carboxylesterase
MKVAGNMSAIANDRALARAIMADPRAGGNWMPARFLRTLLTAEAELPPEAFDVCPATLAHPADDRWTDVSMSRLFDRLGRVPTELVMLENGGHFPVERATPTSSPRKALSPSPLTRDRRTAATGSRWR